MKNPTRLNLTSLSVCPLNTMLDFDTELKAKHWNQRHVFPIDTYTCLLFVDLTFHKETTEERLEKTGIRQQISITVIEAASGKELQKDSFYAYLPKATTSKRYTKEIPFEYTDFDSFDKFKVIVFNESENITLGAYEFSVFDLAEFPDMPCKGLKIEDALITRKCTSYIEINPKLTPWPCISFHGYTLLDPSAPLMQELEIMLHYPDGHIESSILPPTFNKHEIKIENENEPGLNKNEFFVKEHFSLADKGVHYAELRLLGSPIAGFLFNASETEKEGMWKDANEGLSPLYNYEHIDGEKRFHSTIKHYDPKNVDELIDDFFDLMAAELNKEEMADTSWDKGDDDDNTFFNSHPPKRKLTTYKYQPAKKHKNSWENLDELTGLKSVKEKLHGYKKIIDFSKLRSLNGLPTFNIPLHAMFLGSPGTGKTTVAKALGQMLADAGLLSKGHVVVRERSSLLGRYYSSECENTLEALEEARGGILFIDEAYQLLDEHDPRDPGRHVIDTLLTKLSDENDRDWMLILAGYPQQTQRLYEINPGLKSRIPESNIYTFDDFNESELMEIAESYLAKNNYTLSNEARQALSLRLNADYLSRNESFGNARHVMNLIQTNIIPAMASRIIDTRSTKDLTTILECDIPKPICTSANHRRIGFQL